MIETDQINKVAKQDNNAGLGSGRDSGRRIGQGQSFLLGCGPTALRRDLVWNIRRKMFRNQNHGKR